MSSIFALPMAFNDLVFMRDVQHADLPRIETQSPAARP